MPQLDILTFTSQLFWLFLIFTLLYLVMTGYILPTIATILKLRFKLLSGGTTNSSSLGNEGTQIEKDSTSIVVGTLQLSKDLATNLINSGDKWLGASLDQLNSTTILELNKEYLNSINEHLTKSLFVDSILSK